MITKNSTSLIKVDCKHKDNVYDLLISSDDKAKLKTSESIALVYLDSPYYAIRILDEYNNIRIVNIFTIKELKFIYEPFENNKKIKIWYVDDEKEPFKNCNMKFDCIIMNPPYGDRYHPYLHNEIYIDAYKYLSNPGKCISLMPIGKLQTPRLLNKKDLNSTKQITTKIKIITANDANKNFGIALAENLGKYIADNNKKSLIDWNYIAYKSNNDFKNICEKIYANMVPLNKYCDSDVKLKYSYKISLNHGHPGEKDEYDLVTTDERCVFSTKKSSQCCFVNFNTSHERNNFKKYLESIFIKFLRFIERNSLHIYLQMYPWLGDAINPRTGLKGYMGEWTDDDLYKYFNITPEEQKVIEKTMEKYK